VISSGISGVRSTLAAKHEVGDGADGRREGRQHPQLALAVDLIIAATADVATAK
jgi:hypothetical protein